MKIKNSQVASVFDSYPPTFQKKLKVLRKLILQLPNESPEIGELEETLKWGEPSYLPKTKNVGTTVRIHWSKTKPDQYGVYFNCQTTLVRSFKRKFPSVFRYEGKRAIIFNASDRVPVKELRECIKMALTYHYRKRK